MQRPLSEKLRPSSFDEIVGQSQIQEKQWLKSSIKNKKPYSILLYGPPGCGKTSFGRLYAKIFEKPFFFKSAVSTGIAEIRNMLVEQKKAPLFGPCILFLDEIHRYNRAQQDLFLPYIEDGSLILIGATTENPSFAINNALLSRMRLLSFKALDDEGLTQIYNKFEKEYASLDLSEEAKKQLFHASSGDGRYFLNLLELIESEEKPIDTKKLLSILEKKALLYDKNADGHYQLISCLHKAIRGSDPDAALYWLARMLIGGEDSLFIARRLIRMATEDIGLADPQALPLTLSAYETYQKLGSPEGELALAEATVYLALCPKSNRIYSAFNRAKQIAENTSSLLAPAHLVNPVGKSSEELGHGKGYIYEHDHPLSYSGQKFFPEEMTEESFYHPKQYGFEKELAKRMDYFKTLKKKINPDS